ncbi:MAG: hypothetical protein COZ06_39230 [Armatimonadetes bacterium CG_4_10_14_3_um_filter_66_18]|nr:MAG: hypothetical protein COW34_01995 [Armatimonadetes bacterium CG17_big_fil_post_rev_8_21_14_2_50_66_6]PIX46611.1 MAG: hypothetical protein COZ57_11155 [Armatimonadetes bacterium CG_4_8_14_3_um_filter_66_20]PIY34890.1 MAG: hypothetical protein COZ06_39230 [Armatimonadetes bacterium CG_4_10_14_3_um_filter_66_18]PIZ49163.1 MAG: hypothetical protein COY42_04625 [Armatimonadetes bacterium CG_4_10_14_0_8_um_filter_66_14]
MHGNRLHRLVVTGAGVGTALLLMASVPSYAGIVSDSECDDNTKTLCSSDCHYTLLPGPPFSMSEEIISNGVTVASCKLEGTVPGSNCPKKHTVCGTYKVYWGEPDCSGASSSCPWPKGTRNNDCFN